MPLPQFLPPVTSGFDTTAPPLEIKFGVSWLWDFDRGDFSLDHLGRVTQATGEQAWYQWCVKAVLTPRYEHLIYPDDYGSELEAIMRAGYSFPIARVNCESTIRETLSPGVDARCQETKDFAFSRASDGGMEVSFTVVPAIGSEQPLEVTLV